jgi:hypothetical protein
MQSDHNPTSTHNRAGIGPAVPELSVRLGSLEFMLQLWNSDSPANKQRALELADEIARNHWDDVDRSRILRQELIESVEGRSEPSPELVAMRSQIGATS